MSSTKQSPSSGKQSSDATVPLNNHNDDNIEIQFSKRRQHEHKGIEQDTARSWIVAISCCIVMCLTFAFIRIAGIFYVALMDQFHVSHEQASWPLMLCIAFQRIVASPLSGVVAQYVNIAYINAIMTLIASLSISACFWAPNITYVIVMVGIVNGLSSGTVITLSPAVVAYYFEKQRSIALGCVFASIPLFALVLPYVANWMLETYGFRGFMLLFGAITLNAVPFSLLQQTPTIPWHKNKCRDDERSDKSVGAARVILTSPLFYIACPAYITYVTGALLHVSLSNDFAVEIGVEKQKSRLVLMAYAAGDATGCILFGWISDREFIPRYKLCAAGQLFFGLFTALVAACTSFTALMVLYVIIGLTFGCIVSNYAALSSHYFGKERLSIVMGFSGFAGGLSVLIVPKLLGVFKDSMGTYKPIFVIFGAAFALFSLLWCFESRFRNDAPTHCTTTVSTPLNTQSRDSDDEF